MGQLRVQLASKKLDFMCEFQGAKPEARKANCINRVYGAGDGNRIVPKFLSLAETRCYQPLCESIVAKCCQDMVLNFSDKPNNQALETNRDKFGLPNET